MSGFIPISKMEHIHIMELLGAFLTGVVGPILYLIINKITAKRSEKKRDKVKEAIVDIKLEKSLLEIEYGYLNFTMVVTFTQLVNQYKNSQYSMRYPK